MLLYKEQVFHSVAAGRKKTNCEALDTFYFDTLGLCLAALNQRFNWALNHYFVLLEILIYTWLLCMLFTAHS